MFARLMHDLFRRGDGSATVELALIAPIFTTMVLGVVDLTTAFNRKLELEQAVQRSVERVMQTTTDDTVEANIKDEVHQAVGIPTDSVTVTYTLLCSGVSKPYEQDCTSGQTEVRYLTVEATDTFTPMFPLARLGLSKSSFDLKVETGLRTR